MPTKAGNFVKQIKILVHAQDSCACTTLLCMHNTLVHALEGPGPKAGTRKERWGSGLGQRSFWVRALGPGPSSACTRVLCMHKSVVHAQASCACTRISCVYTRISCVCTRDLVYTQEISCVYTTDVDELLTQI